MVGNISYSRNGSTGHDVAALALRGKSACLNFADSAWRLPVPVSNDAKDIRTAANERAELFRPQEFGGCDQASHQNRNAVPEDCSGEVCNDHGRGTFQENDVFFEEAMLDMPGLRRDMRAGLLLPPPYYARNDSFDRDHKENDSYVSLWSY
uniref:AP2/ERF domain-containing protein n=1 Tax=Salix viminalis TaxID=40686 RepID=A0A6N2KB68_SALVM